MATLVLVFKKIESKDKTKYDNFYSSSKAEIFINESDINESDNLYHNYCKHAKSLGKGSCWIINSVIDHTVNISKYNPLLGSSYIKLPNKLDHPRKGLINIQNIDDIECFKQGLFRYLNPADHDSRRITKLDFKNIKFPVKIRDIHKTENNNFIGISVFGNENKEKHPIHVSKKCCEEK